MKWVGISRVVWTSHQEPQGMKAPEWRWNTMLFFFVVQTCIRKKYIRVWGSLYIKNPHVSKLCKTRRNYALRSTHYTFSLFSLESLALSSFQRNSVGGDQAFDWWMNGSTGAGAAADYSTNCNPQAGEAEGRGQVEERRMICIKMGVSFPGGRHWPQWMLNRDLVTSTQITLSICRFLLVLGFLP